MNVLITAGGSHIREGTAVVEGKGGSWMHTGSRAQVQQNIVHGLGRSREREDESNHLNTAAGCRSNVWSNVLSSARLGRVTYAEMIDNMSVFHTVRVPDRRRAMKAGSTTGGCHPASPGHYKSMYHFQLSIPLCAPCPGRSFCIVCLSARRGLAVHAAPHACCAYTTRRRTICIVSSSFSTANH